MPNTGLSGGSANTNGGLGGGQYASANNVGAFTPSNAAGLVQKAYDRLVEFELRATPLIRSVADKKPARQAMPGSSVALQIYNDMAVAKTALSEDVDPAAVSIATPDIVTVTLNEYGNATVVTRKLQLMSLADVDPAVANIIAFNMADSIDELAQDGVVFTQKYPMTFVPKLVLLHGVTHTSTRAMMQSGLAKLVSLKVHTSLSPLVYARAMMAIAAFLFTAHSLQDSKHLLRLLPKNHTWLLVQSLTS